nr:M48 family metallopeptidase [Histophilus somni]
MMSIKKIIFVIFTVLLLNACADSSSINQQSASSYVQIIGQAEAKGVVDKSSPTAKRIHKIFKKMHPYADKENNTGQVFTWQLNVIKSKEMNAWAMPGGKMVFYTGLVDNLKLTDDEIATVMGHEMAHALKEHGKKKANLGTFTNVVAQVAHVALSTKIGTDASGLIVGLAADWGLNKPYSRSAEEEADEVGLFLMAKSGYNPKAAPQLWEKMKKASGGSKGLLDKLISTHPTDDARQANLLKLMPQAIEYYKNRQ